MRLALSSIWVVIGAVGLLVSAEPPPVESGHSEGVRRASEPASPVLKRWTPSNLLARSPVVFEPNQGQFDPEVRFASRASGYNLFITEHEAVFVLPPGRAARQAQSHRRPAASYIEVVRMSFTRAGGPRKVSGARPTGGVSNYYLVL